MENQNVEEKKPIYKKKWFLITVGIIVVLVYAPPILVPPKSRESE